MDPFSIAASIASVLPVVHKVAKGIADFKRAVSEVDESIQDLQIQIDGLGHVLDVLSEAVQDKNNKSSPSAANDRLLHESMPNLVNSCLETLVKVGELMNKFQALGHKTVFKQTWRTIKKQWHQTELDELLARIKTHSMNLQLAGTALALYADSHPHLPS